MSGETQMAVESPPQGQGGCSHSEHNARAGWGAGWGTPSSQHPPTPVAQAGWAPVGSTRVLCQALLQCPSPGRKSWPMLNKQNKAAPFLALSPPGSPRLGVPHGLSQCTGNSRWVMERGTSPAPRALPLSGGGSRNPANISVLSHRQRELGMCWGWMTGPGPAAALTEVGWSHWDCCRARAAPLTAGLLIIPVQEPTQPSPKPAQATPD